MFSLILYVILSAAIVSPPAASPDLTQEFRARDQALLDAIAPGDVKAWDAVLASDAVYVDEAGGIMNRAEFLKQLKPLPAGVSGHIAISAYSLHQSGDVVTVVHTDDEDEFYHGQHLKAQYLTTTTWQLQNGSWKILLVHAYSVLKEPKSMVLSPAELDSYVGRYKAAPELTYTIRREGDHLIGEREGRPNATLKAEVRDVFFVSGQLRTRKMFERDSAGKVTGFVDRREGSDLVWKRRP
jgi:ketosteroid isomerase-like protein